VRLPQILRSALTYRCGEAVVTGAVTGILLAILSIIAYGVVGLPIWLKIIILIAGGGVASWGLYLGAWYEREVQRGAIADSAGCAAIFGAMFIVIGGPLFGISVLSILEQYVGLLTSMAKAMFR
jgi:hypothetical protein